MSEKNKKSAKISIRLDTAIREKLEKLAEKGERTLSDFIRLELSKIANDRKK